MPDAKPTAAQLELTAKRSPTSRRMEAKIGNPRIARPRISTPTGTHGLGNWRKSSGTRRIDRKRSDGSTFRSRTARKCDLWGSRRYATGLFRRRRCWYLNPSSKPTCNRSNAYRAGMNALDAVEAVNRLIRCGHTALIDADLCVYLDEKLHGPLMKSVARRITDRQILHLIKVWIEAPVEETDDRGRKHRTTRNRDEHRGIPQGSPISPLLSNLYMRRLGLWWKQSGTRQRLGAVIVNYADDLVICCKGTADLAMQTMREVIKKLQLEVNEDKTRICRVPGESFDFLGYTFGRCYSRKTGKAYLGTTPSKRSIKRICDAISAETGQHTKTISAEKLVTRLNFKLSGWANYFHLGPVSKAYQVVEAHTNYRLRQWLCRKHRVNGKGIIRYPDQYLYETLRLVRLPGLTRNLPWAKARVLVREPDALVAHVRFDEGSVETGTMARPFRHRQTKGAETDTPDLM